MRKGKIMSEGKPRKGKFGRAIIIVLVIIVVFVCGLFVSNYMPDGWTSKTDTVELGFKDIGELVTQEVDAREIESYDGDPAKIFGISLPFTQSHYIYSYIVVIKAGFNFEEISCDVNDTTKTITVDLPEPYIISSDIDNDSFETYEEENNVFDPFTPEISNELEQEMKDKAENDAIDNGLYEKATTNAETLIKSMIAQNYDIDSDSEDAYTVVINTTSYTGSDVSSAS
jgi:hypothetical protein